MKLQDITKHLNFFRYHLLFFTFTPLIFSGIFYAGNARASSTGELGELQRVSYVDSLFLCFSAMTVTGLVTLNISAIHPFQQALLFILFTMGDFTFVSLIMVLVRKRFFRRHCEQLLLRSKALRPRRTETIFDRAFTFTTSAVKSKKKRNKRFTSAAISGPTDGRPAEGYAPERVTDSPVDFRATRPSASVRGTTEYEREGATDTSESTSQEDNEKSGDTTAQSSLHTTHAPPRPASISIAAPTAAEPRSVQVPFVRARTIQLSEPSAQPRVIARDKLRSRSRGMSFAQETLAPPGIPLRKATTVPVHLHNIPALDTHQNTGMGGFPTPLQLIDRLLPDGAKSTLRRRLTRPERQYTLALGRSETIIPEDPEGGSDDSWGNVRATMARWMPEKLGGLVIGRNSRFFTEELDDEELEELGGVEYRALRLLSYLVPGYILAFQLIPSAIIAIYLAKASQWDSIFQPTAGVQQHSANTTWFSFFLVFSAWSGCGMSLVDQSLVPLTRTYLVIFVLVVVLLAGNHALPMMLRLILWIGTKIWRKGETHETLNFLLDHPRRCFLYLFPSHQTWYLLFVLIAFILLELFGFLVLNIGLPILSSLGGFQMFSDALAQSISVRASGFGVVAIANMAPSLLFLYVVLMYVAIFPIAMSVRSTNVYEEQALGVYEPEDPTMTSEEEPAFQGKRHEVFSKYLAWHLRRQLAFDIWPLTAAVFLICIIERDKLMNNANATWFNIFRIIFECTSAYATVGLSLGTPNNNFSFTGEFKTLSKLVVILVMLRGRHRGLPVAIDRAVLLPHAYARFDRRQEGIDAKNAQAAGAQPDAPGAQSSADPKTA